MRQELLLTPGLLCDAALWDGQTAALADRASSRVADLSAATSIGAMADAALAFAPERFALAGFSMGGCVALEIVARAAGRVERLALLSTNAAGVLPGVRQHYEQSIAVIEAGGLGQYLAEAFPRYVAPVHSGDARLRASFTAMGERLGAAAAVRQMRALLDYGGFAGGLRRIDCPTVLVCGDCDQRTPPAAHQAMAAQIPGARLRVIEASGHFTPLEQPAAVARVLREWLEA